MTARPGDGHRSEAGFTLLELLIALSLLSIMVVFVLGSLRFGRRAWEVADRLDQTTSIAAAQRYLRDTLGRAEPIGTPDAQGRLQLAFQGAGDHLTFVASLDGHTTAAGLHEITIGLRNPQSLALQSSAAVVVDMQLFRPNAKSADRPKPIEERVLAPYASALTFRYFGRMTGTGKASWHSSWNGAFQLPDLIAVAVSFAPGDARTWPELIVAPELR